MELACTSQLVMEIRLTGVQFINHMSDLLIKSMATDIIGRYEVLFPLDRKLHLRRTLERTESWRKTYSVEGAYDFFLNILFKT